jgi:mRNA-degrading endonuclease YafQ of YafQ-DinJ toxin-antitoxin module
MIIEVDESFKKDFKNLKNKDIEKRIIQKLNLLEKANNLNEITNIKKLK